jgi:hypothetical protein
MRRQRRAADASRYTRGLIAGALVIVASQASGQAHDAGPLSADRQRASYIELPVAPPEPEVSKRSPSADRGSQS